MKERPILFSGPMVRAILDGRKTQTRRVVKPQPFFRTRTNGQGVWFWELAKSDLREFINFDEHTCEEVMRKGMPWMCPFGFRGDRLWVRETWCAARRGFLYRAECADEKPSDNTDDWNAPADDRWRPSIHMPRAACRLTLEVVGVRVERLQEISEADAKAEGVDNIDGERIDSERHIKASVLALDGPSKHHGHSYLQRHRAAFWHLWESIYGGGSWEANPWVWVVEFKRTEPTQ